MRENENGDEAAAFLLPAFANCIAKVFTRTFVSFGNRIRLFRFFEPGVKDFCRSITKRFDTSNPVHAINEPALFQD